MTPGQGAAATLALLALAAGLLPGAPAGAQAPDATDPEGCELDGEPYRPQVRPGDFVATVDNPYFPLPRGASWTYEGTGDEGERVTTTVTVTNRSKTVMGVEATVVRDTERVEGELAEDTFDWFAQDRAGNVWYLGEDSREFEDGEVVSTEGSWEAGVDGAQPGVIMPADPQPFSGEYLQECREGVAEDRGEVVSVNSTATVPFGSFQDVLVTREWTLLEPGVMELKRYAPGVGLVMEETVVGGNETLELVEASLAPGAQG